jgi:hypothetical protein
MPLGFGAITFPLINVCPNVIFICQINALLTFVSVSLWAYLHMSLLVLLCKLSNWETETFKLNLVFGFNLNNCQILRIQRN